MGVEGRYPTEEAFKVERGGCAETDANEKEGALDDKETVRIGADAISTYRMLSEERRGVGVTGIILKEQGMRGLGRS